MTTPFGFEDAGDALQPTPTRGTGQRVAEAPRPRWAARAGAVVAVAGLAFSALSSTIVASVSVRPDVQTRNGQEARATRPRLTLVQQRSADILPRVSTLDAFDEGDYEDPDYGL